MNQPSELKLTLVHQENIKPVSVVAGTAGSTSQVIFSLAVPLAYPQPLPVAQPAGK